MQKATKQVSSETSLRVQKDMGAFSDNKQESEKYEDD
jgi:hypothetical protein